MSAMRPTIRPEGPSVSKKKAVLTRHPADQIGIFRHFHRASGGYYFHVMLQRDGKIYQKDFFEKRYGGAENAFKLAQAWRDTIIVEHPAMSMAKFCSIKRSNNTSGVPGVYRCVKTHNSAKNEGAPPRVYWKAGIPLGDGKTRFQSFSVRTYGEDGAKQRAIDARMHGLRELDSLAFRAAGQPHPVSTDDDIDRLAAVLRAPAERRLRKAVEREARQLHDEVRAAEKLAQAKAAEEAALGRPTNRTGEPYIGRYATKKGTSFSWRVSIVRQGACHRKTFSDSTYGGAEGALLAAKAWRDELFCMLPVDSRAQVAKRVKSSNTSGVVGVTRSQEMQKGKLGQFWIGLSPFTKGKSQRRKKYSIAKYGEEQAFALAVKAREAFVAEMGEVTVPQHRAAKQMMRILRQE
jgi:hypothetical protein